MPQPKILTEAEYVKGKGNDCPVCRSSGIATKPAHTQDDGIAYQMCECLYCRATWEDTYALTGYDQLENPLVPAIPDEDWYIWLEVNEDRAILACGCELQRRGDAHDDPRMKLCTTHEAGPKLLEQLANVTDFLESILENTGTMDAVEDALVNNGANIAADARSLITQVTKEGDKT